MMAEKRVKALLYSGDASPQEIKINDDKKELDAIFGGTAAVISISADLVLIVDKEAADKGCPQSKYYIYNNINGRESATGIYGDFAVCGRNGHNLVGIDTIEGVSEHINSSLKTIDEIYNRLK
jgi:hypothetical protein